jgi:hypothetical protein
VVALLGLASATACVFLAAAAGVALLRLSETLDRVLAFATVVLAQIVLTQLVAGAVLESLEPGVVLVVNALVAAVALGAAWRAGALVRPRWPPALAARRLARAAGAHPWEAALAIAVAAVLLWRAFLVLVLPPYAYDGLTYHLTAVAEWLQAGRLHPDPLSLCCAYYPGNGELTMAWTPLFLGEDTLVDGTQLPFAVLGALAVAGLARTLGLTAAGAVAAGSLFALTPIVIAQTTASYVDLMVAAAFLVALHFLVAAFDRPPRLQLLALAGVAAGFAAGVKPTAVPLGAILLALLALGLGVERARGQTTLRDVARALAAFVLPLLLLGSFWYARNAVDFGNPVHPFRVEVAGHVVFAGTRDLNDILTVPEGFAGQPTWEQVARSWAHDVRVWDVGTYTYEQRLGGLGPLWPLLGLPLALVLALGALRRREAQSLTVLAAVVLGVALLPYAWWSRFTMPLAAIGVLGVVAALERLRPGWPRRGLALAASALAAAGVVLALARVDPAGRGRVLPATSVLRLAARPGDERTIGAVFFPEYRWLDDVPRRSAIGVELNAPAIRFLYPLFGPHLERRVFALQALDADSLLHEVRAQRIQYLLVAAAGPYAAWAAATPARFRVVRGSGRGAVVYRVLPK